MAKRTAPLTEREESDLTDLGLKAVPIDYRVLPPLPVQPPPKILNPPAVDDEPTLLADDDIVVTEEVVKGVTYKVATSKSHPELYPCYALNEEACRLLQAKRKEKFKANPVEWDEYKVEKAAAIAAEAAKLAAKG